MTRSRPLLLTALVVVLAAIFPQLAAASTVTVQGTTDIRDAGLLEDVIEPGFAAAYPQYTLKYIPVGTGQAIANAKAGQGDALVTHAPTQEKTFVEEGYSLDPRGRAIFYSDYVVVGPLDDPAGALATAPHNAVGAYEAIAAAGAAGEANFVSRGDNSGTNTQEKAIWKLTGVPLNQLGEPGPPGTMEDAPWYHKAGLGQAETVLLTQQCPFGGGGCYEMSDRGTFNRLIANGSVTELKVVSEKNEALAPGGRNLLTNPFSAYVVNPAKVPAVNVEGARAFVAYLTSPGFQARLADYPNPSSPAFFADAQPAISLSSGPLPSRVAAGTKLTIAGSVTNLLPGAPQVSGQPVTLQWAAPTGPKEAPTYEMIASGVTDSGGGFSLLDAAPAEGRLRVAVPTTASYPSFAVTPLIAVGALSATELDLGNLVVEAKPKPRVGLSRAKIGLREPTVRGRNVRLRGRVSVKERSAGATLVVQGRKRGAKAWRRIRIVHRGKAAAFSVRFKLSEGRWKLRVKYRDPGVVAPATSSARSVFLRSPSR